MIQLQKIMTRYLSQSVMSVFWLDLHALVFHLFVHEVQISHCINEVLKKVLQLCGNSMIVESNGTS